MHKTLIRVSSLLLFAGNNVAFSAANLDAAAIKSVHESTQKAYYEKCMKDFKGANDALCHCMASKAESALDNAALGKCTNDQKGSDCITAVVAQASNSITTKSVMTECAKKTTPGLRTQDKAPPAESTVVPAKMETAPALPPPTPTAQPESEPDSSPPTTSSEEKPIKPANSNGQQ